MHLIKLTVIGPMRMVMYKYLHQIPGGGDLADFTEVSPNTPVAPVIKIQDHHAKLHCHTLGPEDPRPLELAEGLAKRHPDLRFALYYEHEQAYGTIHARAGKVETHAERRK